MTRRGASQASSNAGPTSPSTSDLYSDALAALTSARATMLSPAWQNELDKATPADRLDASRMLIQVQQAILNLTNQSLSDIASQMQANGKELAQSTDNLTKALQNITKIETIIETAGSMIATVGTIVAIL
jgi:septal ring factor EnvC (AmiA/AmiB activator)